MPRWWNGRHKGLKIPRASALASSSLARGIKEKEMKNNVWMLIIGLGVCSPAYAALREPYQKQSPPQETKTEMKEENQEIRKIPAPRSFKFFISPEIYGDGGQNKAFEDDADETIMVAQVLGYAGIKGEVKTTAGFGLKLGGMVPISGIELGGSVGYVWGPKTTQEISASGNANGYGAAAFRNEIEPSYFRGMFEFGKYFELFKRTNTLNLGFSGGIGWASGHVNEDIHLSGSFGTQFNMNLHETYSENWNGLTWEIGPYLSIDRVVEFGIKYAQFPVKKESDDIAKVEFNPVKLYLSLYF